MHSEPVASEVNLNVLHVGDMTFASATVALVLISPWNWG